MYKDFLYKFTNLFLSVWDRQRQFWPVNLAGSLLSLRNYCVTNAKRDAFEGDNCLLQQQWWLLQQQQRLLLCMQPFELQTTIMP